MKNSSLFFLLILIAIVLTSCNKEALEISYDESGYYGTNILSLEDSTFILPYESYSLSADLEKDAAFQVDLYNLSDPNVNPLGIWSYDGSTNEGWLISDYSFQQNSQAFRAKETGKLDLRIEFSGNGSCELKYFENGDLCCTKCLFW